MSEITKVFAIVVPLRILFEHVTIRGFAEWMAQAENQSTSDGTALAALTADDSVSAMWFHEIVTAK